MSQPRPKSRNKLHSALLDIHRDIWMGGKTLEDISVAQYSKKYKIRNFGKSTIAELMSRPTEPTINDATELARLLSYNAQYVRVGKIQRWNRENNQAPNLPNLEQRRYEIAKDLVVSQFHSTDANMRAFAYQNKEMAIREAIELADCLIEKLKGK